MENDFRSVVDTLPGLVWTALPDGNIAFLSQSWCTYTGLSADEIRERGWEAVVHPEDVPELLRSISSTSGAPCEVEVRLRRFDGTFRCFLMRVSALTDASGKVVLRSGINIDIDDRKRWEDELRESESRHRQMLDGLPNHVMLMTPGGEIEYANLRVQEYFDATEDEIQGRSILDAVHPGDLASVLEAWTRSVGRGTPYDVEQRIRRSDGIYRWFHACGVPLRDEEGRIALWYQVQTDVDDRRRAEALLAGEKRLLEMVASRIALPVVLEALCRLVEETAPDFLCSILIVDEATRFRHGAAPSLPPVYYASKAGRPVQCESGPCGTAASLRSQTIVPDIALETRWDASGWRASTLKHGLRSCWSTPILSRAQKALGTFAIYRREPGTPTAAQRDLISQLTHIASIAIERAHSEAELRRSQAFLTEAESLSATGSFSVNPTSGAHWWSEQTYRIFDVDRARPPTVQAMRERVHPDDLELLDHALECAERGEGRSTELRLQMPDGTLKHLQIVTDAIEGSLDGTFEFVGAVRDVTEQRLSEEALAKARSELAHVARVTSLGVLTASIAHEVNQPLSGIITNASTCLRMLATDPPDVEGARETARRTIRDGNRATDVITRLRALFGRKIATSESLDLNEAAREVIALTRNELKSARVILRQEFADDLPSIVGDRVQLQQVILNLILNAADAMSCVDDRPRRLVIRTERDEGDLIRLTVRDAGIGFAHDDAEKLFEPFYTTKAGGMGIGLSVSRSIIEGHHGRLWARRNDGVGATLSFTIPSKPRSVTGLRRGGVTPTAPTANLSRDC